MSELKENNINRQEIIDTIRKNQVCYEWVDFTYYTNAQLLLTKDYFEQSSVIDKNN